MSFDITSVSLFACSFFLFPSLHLGYIIQHLLNVVKHKMKVLLNILFYLLFIVKCTLDNMTS